MISFLKTIVAFVNFMLAELVILVSVDSKSKSETIGWYFLAIVFVLDMILIWI